MKKKMYLNIEDFKDDKNNLNIHNIFYFLLNLDKFTDGCFYIFLDTEINNVDFINCMFQYNIWNTNFLHYIEKNYNYEYSCLTNSLIEILSNYFILCDDNDDDIEKNYEIIYLVSFYFSKNEKNFEIFLNNVLKTIQNDKTLMHFFYISKQKIPSWLTNATFFY